MSGILCTLALLASNGVQPGQKDIGPLISKSRTAETIGLALLQDFTERLPGLLIPQDRTWVRVSRNKRYWLVRSVVPPAATEDAFICGRPCEVILDASTAKMVLLHLVEDKDSQKRRSKFGF